jgi:hypothetical protein
VIAFVLLGIFLIGLKSIGQGVFELIDLFKFKRLLGVSLGEIFLYLLFLVFVEDVVEAIAVVAKVLWL